MKRIIVCIVSEQTVPNYIFIKDFINLGDELLFISSSKMKYKIEIILNTLNYVNCVVNDIIFPLDNDEEKWDVMKVVMENKIKELTSQHKEIEFIVNLTGGTKYMSLAVQQCFEQYNSRFYYIPFPKNYILSPSIVSNSKPLDIKFRISVDEYMSLSNLKFRNSKISQSEEFSNSFFNLFNEKFNKKDFDIIDRLRPYRDYNINISEVENKEIETERKPQIPNLKSFLESINFPLESTDKLLKHEIQYITGGWFEEYVFYLIKRMVKPTDIQFGILIERTQRTNMNDLDVVFTLGNKLFVVECKTGIGKESLFNQIVYKASALKEYLLGLSANSYIFSLTSADEKLFQTSNNMGVVYIDKSYFVDSNKTDEIMSLIIRKAY